MQYISQIFKQCGEKPKLGICGVGTWTQLTRDFTPYERYNTNSSGAYGEEGNTVNALFDAVMIAGVPVYCDPAAPEGTLYFLNTDYMSLYLHERAAFTFTGFEPLLSNNQFGYIGALLTLAQLVNVKPITQGKFANLNYLPI